MASIQDKLVVVRQITQDTVRRGVSRQNVMPGRWADTKSVIPEMEGFVLNMSQAMGFYGEQTGVRLSARGDSM